MPRARTIKGELAAAIRRGKAEGRLGPEHSLDVERARLLVAMLADPDTPRSSIAPLDRRLDVVLVRLGFVVDVSGPTELDAWLAGLDDESEPDEGAGARSAEDLGPD